MQTQLLTAKEIVKAGEILRGGGLVGIPTETVYGLAADSTNERAVRSIFEAKGRPSDNPLIVHIAEQEELSGLAREVPHLAWSAVEAFWPGALTLILRRSNLVNNTVSAGLDSVAVRLPGHQLAREIIKATGRPLAAPSANISGSPSPTTAQHVIEDLRNKIDAVIDGGACSVGVESTVVSFLGERPRLLRPGGVTLEQLEERLGRVDVDRLVLEEARSGEQVASPGMKYKHYAPKAEVIIIKGSGEKYVNYVNSHAQKGVAALCYDGDCNLLKVRAISYGEESDHSEQARRFFGALREIDAQRDIKLVYARSPEPVVMGLSVYNRLLRAAGFRVVEV